MNEFDILEAIGEVDDEFIASAKLKKSRKRQRAIGNAVLGSLLLVAISISILLPTVLNTAEPVTAPPSEPECPKTLEALSSDLPPQTPPLSTDDTTDGLTDIPPEQLGPQVTLPDFIPSFYRAELIFDGIQYTVTDDEEVKALVIWTTKFMTSASSLKDTSKSEALHRYTVILFYGGKIVCDLTVTDGRDGNYYVTNNATKITYSIDKVLFLNLYTIIEDIKK